MTKKGPLASAVVAGSDDDQRSPLINAEEEFTADDESDLLSWSAADVNYAGETTADEDFQADRSHDEHSTTSLQTFFHLVKGNIEQHNNPASHQHLCFRFPSPKTINSLIHPGTGILAMPIAVKNAGLFPGTIGILFLGFLSTFCMHQLLRCNRQLLKRTAKKKLSYAQVAYYSFKTGPRHLQRFATAAALTANIFIVFTQIGFCCVYVVFIAQYVKEIVDENTDKAKDLHILEYELILIPFVVIYCMVRNLRHLAPFSMIANVLLLGSLLVIFQLLLTRIEDYRERTEISTLAGLSKFFGSAMYAFEAIGLILPMENKMRRPKEFGGTCGLLSMTMALVVVTYAALGFYGYLKFGEDTAIILSNLSGLNPQWLYDLVKLAFVFSVFISFNLQLYPVVVICYPSIKRRFMDYNCVRKYGEYLFRLLLVCIASAIAIVVPCLDDLISLIGAFASAAIALWFPPILESVCFSAKMHRNCYLKLIRNIIIVVFGMFGAVCGTYVSLSNIVKKVHSHSCS